MHKRINNRVFLLVMVTVSMFVLFIGYASINNINLIISGTANATGIKSSEDFKVKFNQVIVDNSLNPEGVTVTGNIVNDHEANFTATGLLGYGDTATIKFAVLNNSNYYSASLVDIDQIVNNKPQYFAIERTIVDSTGAEINKIDPGETAYYKIKVTVIKVPSSEAQTANITVYLNATSEPYLGG